MKVIIDERISNQRYRSFAERYMIERCRLWPVGCDAAEMAHKTALEARTAYRVIKELGTTIEPND